MSIRFIPTSIHSATDVNKVRKRAGFSLLVSMLALLASLQLAGNQPDEAGQRRVGETRLTERKKACRDCVLPTLLNAALLGKTDRAELSPISLN